jgi:O-acetyl-ADP-ribose deacetylase (regulator of RNase III)
MLFPGLKVLYLNVKRSPIRIRINMYIKRKVFSKKDSASTNAAIGAGAGAAGVTGASALAAGSIKAKKLADKMEKKRAEEGKAIMEKVKAKEKEITHTIYPNREKAKKAEEELKAVEKEAKAALKKVKEPKKVEKVLRAIGKPAEKVAKIVLK